MGEYRDLLTADREQASQDAEDDIILFHTMQAILYYMQLNQMESMELADKEIKAVAG